MKNFILLFLFIFISGCSSQANNIDFKNINGFYNDDLDLAFKIFKKSCKQSSKKKLFTDVCKNIDSSNNGKDFFTKNFSVKQLIPKNEAAILITGYYEPLLKGSRKKSKIYKYPIYKTPKDLITLKDKKKYKDFKRYKYKVKLLNGEYIPYDTREEIQKRNDLEVICYTNSLVDLFFLQVQGSGRVLLDNEKIINVSFASQNGRKYSSIGKKLVADGEIAEDKISLQSIRKYIKNNPNKLNELFNYNKSYVFFVQSKRRATGSLNVELVGKRNIAVDTKYIPLGSPVFIQTINPKTKEPINKLVIAADTGGAIKGKSRIDYFYGFGKEAEELAGLMKEESNAYILVPKVFKK